MTRSTRVLLLTLLVAAAVVAGYFAYRELGHPAPDTVGQDQPKRAKPESKLVVLVVFDQMRGDYLDRWDSHFTTDGFNRMKRDGVWYSDVEIPYACTSTGPGHASLVSGAPPSVTGIIENEWWDRKAAARVYCCQPARPYESVPPLPVAPGEPGRGSELGFSPERLLAETVGDRLKAATDGKGRVFSLSIKDRTAVLMGGKKPDAAYCFDIRDGLFHTGAYYREQTHPWVAEFNAGKPADKWFKQEWTVFDAKLDYAKAVGQKDDAAGEGTGYNGQGRVFPHPFNGKLQAPAKDYYAAVECSPAANELLLALAKKAIAAEKIGQDETTDLLCLSFSSNDIIGHIYGPDSWEMLDITMRSDRLIADLLAFLDETVGKDRYTLVVSADHGVCPLPELDKNPFPSAKRVKVTDVYGELAARLDAVYRVNPGRPMQWFETADARDLDRVWPWVYLNHKAITARGLDVEDVTDFVRGRLAGRDDIANAYTRKQIESDKFADGSPGVKVKLAYHPDRCGDVIAVPKAGVLVTAYNNGTSHGTPHRYDSHVPVLAFGRGVPALGKKTDKLSSLIVAPILAKSLGIDPPKDAVAKAPF